MLEIFGTAPQRFDFPDKAELVGGAVPVPELIVSEVSVVPLD